MHYTAVLTPDNASGFVALNPETGTTSQGENVEDALANLREATALYVEECPQTSPAHPVVTTFSLTESA